VATVVAKVLSSSKEKGILKKTINWLSIVLEFQYCSILTMITTAK